MRGGGFKLELGIVDWLRDDGHPADPHDKATVEKIREKLPFLNGRVSCQAVPRLSPYRVSPERKLPKNRQSRQPKVLNYRI